MIFEFLFQEWHFLKPDFQKYLYKYRILPECVSENHTLKERQLGKSVMEIDWSWENQNQ